MISKNSNPASKKLQAKNCFVCGYDNPRGLNIPFFYNGAIVESEFAPGPELCGFDNIVHGGIVFSLADEAMMHLIWASDLLAVTAEITMRYHSFAKINDIIKLSAEFESVTDRLIKARCVLTNDRAEKIATARGKFLPFSKGDENTFKKLF